MTQPQNHDREHRGLSISIPQLKQEETRLKKKLTNLWLYPEVAGLLFNYTRLHKITGYLGEMSALRMVAVVGDPGCCLGSWYEKLLFPSVELVLFKVYIQTSQTRLIFSHWW